MQVYVNPENVPARRHGMPQGAAGQLDALGTVMVFRPNAEIFGIGAQANYCFKVLSGAVRVVRLTTDGKRQILEFLLPGDFFGFDCISQHHASAEAIMRTTLVRYSRQRLGVLTEADPALNRLVRGMVSEKLEAAHRLVLLLGRKSADERIGAFLLELAGRTDAHACEFDLPMTRNDIADHLGLTLETVSRILNRLKRAGTIELPTAARIRLRDRATLEALYGEL